MSDRKITHKVKLQKSVIIILGVLAVGVMANAFAPAFSVKSADAASGSHMIATGNLDRVRDPYIFQLQNGSQRFCAENKLKLYCSNWKK
jgi:hypothetical protein